MDIFVIIAILLVIVCLAVCLFSGETTAAKLYKAMGAACMAVLGTVGIKLLFDNQGTGGLNV